MFAEDVYQAPAPDTDAGVAVAREAVVARAFVAARAVVELDGEAIVSELCSAGVDASVTVPEGPLEHALATNRPAKTRERAAPRTISAGTVLLSQDSGEWLAESFMLPWR